MINFIFIKIIFVAVMVLIHTVDDINRHVPRHS